MAGGGIHDQLGGGFHRYAVDATGRCPTSRRCSTTTPCSRVPTCTAVPAVRRPAACWRCADDTLDWALREMRGPEGGFYSALDADSEGVEGRFYVWTHRRTGRGPRRGRRRRRSAGWGAASEGNFVDPHHPEPGLNVLRIAARDPTRRRTRERIRARLLEARAARAHDPGSTTSA